MQSTHHLNKQRTYSVRCWRSQGCSTCCLVYSVLKFKIDHLRPHKEHQTDTSKVKFRSSATSIKFSYNRHVEENALPQTELTYSVLSVFKYSLSVCPAVVCSWIEGLALISLAGLGSGSLAGLASGSLARQRKLRAQLVFPMINNLFLCFWLKFNKKMFQQGKDLLKAGEERSTFAPHKTNPSISLVSHIPYLSGRSWVS